MASYNGDFNKMQEEALIRLREMQKRSRTAVNHPHPQANAPNASNVQPHTPHSSNTHGNSQHPPPAYPPPNMSQSNNQGHTGNNHQSQNKSQSGAQNNPPQPDILKSLLGGDGKIDTEKALILLMLFVLYKNKADMKLLLALGYLLM